jgi:hypothetical protein
MIAMPAFAASPDLLISVDVGALHFPGENAQMFITTTANGALVNPDTITATLYLPNGVNTIAPSPTNVGTGVYMANYTIPDGALTGFYAVVVTASYSGGSFKGSAVKGFEVSQGLSDMQGSILSAIGGLSGQLSSVESNVLSSISSTLNSLNSSFTNQLNGTNGKVTALSTQVTSLQSSISANLTSLAGSVASLSTAVQTLVTNSQTAITGAITTAQTAITGAITLASSSTQTQVNSARDAILTPVNTMAGQISTISDTTLNNIQTFVYVILAVAILTLLVAIVLIFMKRK